MTSIFDSILFDLDGTLIDTLEDLANATNWALQNFDCPTHPLGSYRYFVGNGVRTLCARALPSTRQDLLENTIELMKSHYHNHCFDKTTVYPGIFDLLEKLMNRDILLCILSNKPDDFTKRLVKHYFPGNPFQIVRGHIPGTPPKPDPTAALQIAEELQISPNRFIYIGDTNTDMETASTAGMYAVGVLWGFRTREELLHAGAKQIVNTPSEILSFIKTSPL